MNRIFILFALNMFFSGIIAVRAQSSFSLNYLYLGGREKRTAEFSVEAAKEYSYRVSKSLASNGIGLQGKIYLKNMKEQMLIMPDIGYFFEEYEKLEVTGNRLRNAYRENKLKYIAANINIGYIIFPEKSSSFIFFAGAGYFHEIMWSHIYSEGEFPITFAIDEEDDFSKGTVVLNMGLDWKPYLWRKIFANVGLKYMFDILDTKFNVFPYINVGIGYTF